MNQALKLIWLKAGLILLFMFMKSSPLPAEGVKELMPDSVLSSAGLFIENYSGSIYTKFATINCAPNYRLYIHIKNAGEAILFGIKGTSAFYQYNLRNPSGAIVLTGSSPSVAGQTGYIRYFKQAQTGPFPASGGYAPIVYQVTSSSDTGNYYFEFTNSGIQQLVIDYWDFQVVTGAHTPALPADTLNGRVWSQSWQLYADLGMDRKFNAKLFVYSDDQIVTKVRFSNGRVGAVTIFCNPYGCLNTGVFSNDRQSKNTNTFITFPAIAQYKVFLNNPDSTVYPSGVYGQIIGTPYMIADTAYPPCSGKKFIVVEVNKAGNVQVIITFPYGGSATAVNLYAPVVPGVNFIFWDGNDGLGVPVPDGTTITVSVTFVNGLTNLPIWDQEQNPDGYFITLIRPYSSASPVPLSYWDDSQLVPTSGGFENCYYPPQTANLTGCLPGSIPGYSGCHPWIPLGNGDCHNKMINTWWYGSASTVPFSECFAGMPANPVGHDSTRCGPGSVTLYATVPATETVDWYAIPVGGVPLLVGDTAFTTPPLITTTVYYAEARSDSNGCLSPARTPVTAFINTIPSPTINGPDTLCKGTSNHIYFTQPAKSNYIWGISPGGTITSGNGTDSITVTWNASGLQYVDVSYTDTNGCPGSSPAFNVAVFPPPDSAGLINGLHDVCAGMNGVEYFVAPVPYAQTYQWTTPQGMAIVSGAGTNLIIVNFALNAVSGYISVHAINPCGTGAPSPPFWVTVNYSPTAYAGPDDTICQGTACKILQASATNFKSVYWTTTGQGTITDDSTMYPTYIADPAETGTIILVLHAVGIPPCGSAVSQMELNIQTAPVAYAGPPLFSCGLAPVTISGSAAYNYQSLSWETSGTGTFNDPSLLHPIYSASIDDSINGNTLLSLIVSGASRCLPDTGKVILTIGGNATANAGPDASVCEGNNYLTEAAFAQNYTSLDWTSSGTGTFMDPHSIKMIYIPGKEDIDNGKVLLTLNAGATPPCTASSDVMELLIDHAPVVDAGPGGSACTTGPIEVTGANAAHFSSLSWIHDGTGILEGANTITPVYHPAPGDTGDITLTLKVWGIASCADTFVTSKTIFHFYSPIQSDAGPDQSVIPGTQASLSGSATGGSGSYAWYWEPASLLTDNTIPNPQTIKLSASAQFLVTVTDLVTGCKSSDTIMVKVVPGKPENEDCIIIYNLVTPNGDGVNDTWIIDCIENFPDNTVRIFNRWGDLVNSYDHYNNFSKVWDGADFKGTRLPDGTYFYIINIKNSEGFKGWVYLRGGSE